MRELTPQHDLRKVKTSVRNVRWRNSRHAIAGRSETGATVKVTGISLYNGTKCQQCEISADSCVKITMPQAASELAPEGTGYRAKTRFA